MSDPIEDLKRFGISMEPDRGQGPRRSIIHTEKIIGTRSGKKCLLACNHMVQIFGDLPEDRMLFCTRCREEGLNAGA